MACNLEVDVNGEQVFLVDKEILISFSGKLRKILSKSVGVAKLKVVFHNLPGGPGAFELMARFCYHNGDMFITPGNVFAMYSIAHFMEMNEDICGKNLIQQTEKSLKGMLCWAWTDLIVLLKQCQELDKFAESTGVLGNCLELVALRIDSLNSERSPCTSSPCSASIRLSSDTKSTESTKPNYFPHWWFEDLVAFDFIIVEKLIRLLIHKKFDQQVIGRFVYFYLRSRVSTVQFNKKVQLVESIIDLLFFLNIDSMPCRSLFGLLHITSKLDVSEPRRNRLESMIGSQLDQATLDNLLVPTLSNGVLLYDVSLILRFLKSFLRTSSQCSSSKLRSVGTLMDMYLSEVAPDSRLKPSKFIALATALPDSSRESHDGIYRAVDIYLEVHKGLCEGDKLKICSLFSYEKLSPQTRKHLMRNSKFPPQLYLLQQSKLERSILQRQISIISNGLPAPSQSKDSTDQRVAAVGQVDFHKDDTALAANLQQVQKRVGELEQICRKMQSQMTKMKNSRRRSSRKSLPMLCSHIRIDKNRPTAL